MDNHPLVRLLRRKLDCLEAGERIAREELYAEVMKMISDPDWYGYEELILLVYRLRHYRDSGQSLRDDTGNWLKEG